MSDGWTLADLRATAIMDTARTGAVAERNGRRLAEAAGRASPPSVSTHASTQPALACLEFTVPSSPRGWEKPKPVGYGRTIKGQDERAWQSDIAKYARQAKDAAGATGLIRGGVRLSVIAYIEVPKSYRPTRRADCLAGRVLPIIKPDWDRIENSVGDALTGVLWVDDKQVVAGSCLKMWAETGSLYVRVQAL